MTSRSSLIPFPLPLQLTATLCITCAGVCVCVGGGEVCRSVWGCVCGEGCRSVCVVGKVCRSVCVVGGRGIECVWWGM